MFHLRYGKEGGQVVKGRVVTRKTTTNWNHSSECEWEQIDIKLPLFAGFELVALEGFIRLLHQSHYV
jgi:hypothetical protein